MAGGQALQKTMRNLLSGLLEAEEEEEFYQMTYGGFTEEAGHEKYQRNQSDTEEVDSDFNMDERDKPFSDGEAGEPGKKHRIVIKAYIRSLLRT